MLCLDGMIQGGQSSTSKTSICSWLVRDITASVFSSQKIFKKKRKKEKEKKEHFSFSWFCFLAKTWTSFILSDINQTFNPNKQDLTA
jgi:hypothetical protein